jgi:branched-chain amino acid transport system ATP-binding protein
MMMLLDVKELVVGYGKKVALRGVSLNVGEAELVGVIGHNGAGKTTLLRSIFGLLPPWEGRIIYKGRDIAGRRTEVNVREGLSYMPQGQGLFPDLSVIDNLDLGAYALGKTASSVSIGQVMDLFPILRSRKNQKAGTLSGGEQRMLSLGIALMQSPKLLLLDEPSIGLAPIIVQNVMETVKEVNHRLKTGIFIVEQNIDATSRIVDRIFIIKVGEVVFSGSSDIAKDKQRLWQLF